MFFQKKLLALASVALSSLAVFSSVSAQILVNPFLKQVKFTDPKYFNFRVYNLDDKKTTYIKVITMRKKIDQNGKTSWVGMKHNPRQFGLVVSPVKLSVPANESRPVQALILLHKYTQDVFYKVLFSPVRRPLKLVESKMSKDKNAKIEAGGIQLIISESPIIVLRPLNPHATITFKREGKKLIIHNKGNSYADLFNLKLCQNKSHCNKKELNNKVYTLYAGTTVKIDLPKIGPVKFKESFMNHQRELYTS